MLCIWRRKWANFCQSPSGRWEPASSVRRTANQGSKCLFEAQPGLNRGWELQNGFLWNYQEINQPKSGRINSSFVYICDSYTFWFQKFFATMKNNGVLKKLLFKWTMSINIYCIRNKKRLKYVSIHLIEHNKPITCKHELLIFL